MFISFLKIFYPVRLFHPVLIFGTQEYLEKLRIFCHTQGRYFVVHTTSREIICRFLTFYGPSATEASGMK